MIKITPFDLAQRFVGMKGVKGLVESPQILALSTRDAQWPMHDEVPWCSSFVNYICWLLRLPRSKSLMARSWLQVGEPLHHYTDAKVGFDVVILNRQIGGKSPPGQDITDAPGHVGFYAGRNAEYVYLLGGNHGDVVNVSRYHLNRILRIHRLWTCNICVE